MYRHAAAELLLSGLPTPGLIGLAALSIMLAGLPEFRPDTS